MPLTPDQQIKLESIFSVSEMHIANYLLLANLEKEFGDVLVNIDQPYVTGGQPPNRYAISFSRALSEHFACHKQIPYVYTFFVLTPLGDFPNHTIPTDQDSLKKLALDLIPGREDMDKLTQGMNDMLEQIVWKEEGYQFKHLINTINVKGLGIIIFSELKSVTRLVNSKS